MAKNVQLTIDIKGNDSVGKAAEATKSLKTQLKELKAELASGNLTGKAFDEAAKKAGQLQDSIGDVNQRVKNLASDTGKLDGFIDVATGITGGFAAAQGAMALFGNENEDVQKQLVKIQGAVALLNGVQQVANTLNKDSAAITQLQSIRLKILTAVQGRYTAVVGTTTGAMKLLRIAGATLGIGLIVTAIGLLIANFGKIKKVVLDFIPGLANLGEVFNKVKNAVMDFLGFSSEAERQQEKSIETDKAKSKSMQREIDLMEAQGQSVEAIYKKKKELLELDLKALKIAKEKAGASQEETDAYEDALNAIAVLDAEEIKRKQDLVSKANLEASKKRKEEAEKAKKEFEDNKKTALQRAKDAQKELIKKFEDDQKAIKDDKQAKLDIEEEYQDGLSEKEIEARKKLNEEKEKLEKEHLDRVKEYKELEAQTEKDLQDAKVQAVQTGAQILGQFAGQSKALALTALAIEKGAAIAGVIINASRELSANSLTASLNPLNGATFGAAGAAQLVKSNALTKIRAGISIASISAAGLSGAKNITSGGSGGGGGSVQPPNIRGSQTSNEPTQQPMNKVFVTETDIRSVTRKVDGIYTQSTIV